MEPLKLTIKNGQLAKQMNVNHDLNNIKMVRITIDLPNTNILPDRYRRKYILEEYNPDDVNDTEERLIQLLPGQAIHYKTRETLREALDSLLAGPTYPNIERTRVFFRWRQTGANPMKGSLVAKSFYLSEWLPHVTAVQSQWLRNGKDGDSVFKLDLILEDASRKAFWDTSFGDAAFSDALYSRDFESSLATLYGFTSIQHHWSMKDQLSEFSSDSCPPRKSLVVLRLVAGLREEEALLEAWIDFLEHFHSVLRRAYRLHGLSGLSVRKLDAARRNARRKCLDLEILARERGLLFDEDEELD
jgi:hypothetical protein